MDHTPPTDSPSTSVSSSKHDEKSPDALRTIGEVSEELDIPQHVLRFWENKFAQLSPEKRRGRRYYTQKDIALLKKIKHLLKQQGYTIKGVQKYFKEFTVKQSDSHTEKQTELFPDTTLPSQDTSKTAINHDIERLKEAVKLKKILENLMDASKKLKKHLT